MAESADKAASFIEFVELLDGFGDVTALSELLCCVGCTHDLCNRAFINVSIFDPFAFFSGSIT